MTRNDENGRLGTRQKRTKCRNQEGAPGRPTRMTRIHAPTGDCRPDPQAHQDGKGSVISSGGTSEISLYLCGAFLPDRLRRINQPRRLVRLGELSAPR
jgi:hypothetical protein